MSLQTSERPLIIFGFDSANSDLLLRWSNEGHLPAIATLLNRGAWARLDGSENISEHGTEHAIFTGVSRAQHGYYWFRQLTPGTYDMKPFSAWDTGVKPFWQYLAGTGKRAAIIDASECALVEGLDGFQLLNWASHQAAIPTLPPVSQPFSLLARTHEIFGPQIKILEYKLGDGPQDDLVAIQGLIKRAEKGALCRALLGNDPYDLIVICFHEAHTGGHRAWPYHADLGPDQQNEELKNGLLDLYKAIDRQLGEILAHLPADANVVLFSPYGMESFYPTEGLVNGFCQQLGYHHLKPPSVGTSSLSPLGLARRLMPEPLRRALSHYLPKDTQQRLLFDALRLGTEWAQTTAFGIPSIYTGMIRINLRGREPQGIVNPGADYQAALDKLETDLKSLLEPIHNTQAVVRVVRTCEWFGIDPLTNLLPDLFVDWQPSTHFWPGLKHPKTTITQHKPGYYRGSYHRYDGFTAFAGPAFTAHREQPTVDLLDLAPTFLTVLGQPVPANLKGRVLSALLA